MRRFLASAFVMCLFCVAPTAQAAVFTDSQINSLLGLLTAFGVPQDTIDLVHVILDPNSSGESTFTPGSGQKVTYISHHSRVDASPEQEVNTYVAKAVHLDGSTWLINPSLTTNAHVTAVSVSAWFKIPASGGNQHQTLYIVDPDDTYQSNINFHNADNPGFGVGGGTGPYSGDEPGANISFQLANAESFSTEAHNAHTSNFPVDDTWHHLLYSADTTSGQVKVYIDGVDVTATGFISVPFEAPFNGLPLWVGNDDFGDTIVGDLADVWIAPGVSLLNGGGTIPQATIRKFIDTNGKPVDLGTNCSNATGSAPTVCLTGDSTTFDTNVGTGGSFSTTGTLTNAASSPSD